MSEEKKSRKKEKSTPTALRILLPLLFLVLLLTGIYALYPLFAPNNGPEIVMNAINLRGEADTMMRSRMITDTDDMVRDLGIRQVQGEWELLTQCMPQGCEDSQYFNFITVVTQNVDIPNKDLIQNLVVTYKYWDSEELVRFSKAMTLVERLVEEAYSRSLDEKWQQIVACDGKCAEENDLYFEIIEIAVTL